MPSFQDNFTGTSGAGLSVRTGWQRLSGATEPCTISAAGALSFASTGSTSTWVIYTPTLSAGSADQYVAGSIGTSTAHQPLGLRITAASGYLLRYSGTQLILSRYSATTISAVGNWTRTLATTDVVRVEVSGSTFTAYVNGVALSPTYADASYATGEPGLVARGAAAGAGLLDDWDSGGLSGGGAATGGSQGALTLTGSATGAALVAGGATGGLSVAGAATGAAWATGGATATAGLGGAAAGAVAVFGTSSAGLARVAGQASGVTGSTATGGSFAALPGAAGTASGAVLVAGAGAALATGVSGASLGTALVTGGGGGGLAGVTGFGSGSVASAGAAVGVSSALLAGVSGEGGGQSRVAASSTASLRAGGAGSGSSRVTGGALGGLFVTGTATGTAGGATTMVGPLLSPAAARFTPMSAVETTFAMFAETIVWRSVPPVPVRSIRYEDDADGQIRGSGLRRLTFEVIAARLPAAPVRGAVFTATDGDWRVTQVSQPSAEGLYALGVERA